MPTYDYRCEKCNTEFEEFQSMSAEPKANCPKCGSEAKRLFSTGAGLIFKGSGFYVNDYKKKCENTASSKPESCSG